jgi:hypothetical protein
MAWIRIDGSTPHKPEIGRLADALGCTLEEGFFQFVTLYLWADANVSCPGFVPKMSLRLMDKLARVKPGTCEALALPSIGWLKEENDGIQFVNWERHNGKSAKQRVYDRERKVDQRFRSGQNRDKTGTKHGTKTGLEKRREDKSNITPLSPLFDDGKFKELWTDWRRHRSEIQHPLKPTQEAKQLKKLEAMGLERAIAALTNSLEGGYQGIFEPKPNGVNGHPDKPLFTDEELGIK